MTREEMLTYTHKFKPYRKLMTPDKMAAQFLPFAALTGFEEIIQDARKELVDKKVLSSEQIEELNRKIIQLDKIHNPKITVTYFQCEGLNHKGKYIVKEGTLKKVDKDNKYLIFSDNSKISLNLISDIQSNVISDFDNYF